MISTSFSQSLHLLILKSEIILFWEKLFPFFFLGLYPFVSIFLLERKQRLTFSCPDSFFWARALAAFSGRGGRIHDVGPFLDVWLLPWQGFIVFDILSAPSSIGCFFITLRSFSENTRAGLSGSTASCVR
jgi:hypothetical protein